MKICFCSTFLSNEKEAIAKSKNAPSVSTHNFNLNLIRGLRSNVGDDLTIINTEKIASYPNYKDLLIKSSYLDNHSVGSYLNIGKLNLPIFKDFLEINLVYRSLKGWVELNKTEDLYIVAYGRRLSHIIAINKIKDKYKNVNTCMVLADLSGNAACKINKKENFKSKMLSRLLEYQVNESTKFDSFVLLTEQMKSYLKIENKPSVIIEGIHSIDEKYNNDFNEKREENKKIVAYSGILSKEYNVDNLINSFKMELLQDCELWLFGDGELNNYIKEICKNTKNIKFFGYVDNKTLKNKLEEATVLVNPRLNIGEYTKYSFPSKIIEYMSLSKPVIAYKLDGAPDEYDKYIIYPKDNTIDELAMKIKEVCSYDYFKRKKIGIENFNFIKDHKNSTAQTFKIIEMFKYMNKDNI